MYRLTRGLLSKAQLQNVFIDGVDVHHRGLAVASSQMAAIKSLRERTNAPISDVKSALMEAEWDLGELMLLKTIPSPGYVQLIPMTLQNLIVLLHLSLAQNVAISALPPDSLRLPHQVDYIILYATRNSFCLLSEGAYKALRKKGVAAASKKVRQSLLTKFALY